MGSCFSGNCYHTEPSIPFQLVLKFPNGKEGILFNELTGKFIHCPSIQEWLHIIYEKTRWAHYIVYNDEVTTNHTICPGGRNGHCKGIITWNSQTIRWLCHSVPKYPDQITFDEQGHISFSEIEQGELIYGQSFQYMDFPYDETLLRKIICQLTIMEANIYSQSSNYGKKVYDIYCPPHIISSVSKKTVIPDRPVRTIQLSKNIFHIAKSPHYHIDIYSEYLLDTAKGLWNIQSWKRGQEYPPSLFINDIKQIQYNDIIYRSSQDHSKWGTNGSTLYWIGDLNRMISQKKRGGGGFLCYHSEISIELLHLIVDSMSPRYHPPE
jgi:hypothetical protein